jgi:photosystem II stability/assembly factor-like uncharacterized protein
MRAEFLPPEMVFFENSQDPHCMDQCASEPARMWVQHHNGIFRSDDYGRSWSEIQTAEPSAVGFAVRVDPTDPDTAWFVPGVSDETRVPVDGALCVTRTRDGGKTFEQLRNGLPQTDGWDIVLRHALDVSACGRTVAFGSTTGNLYVSNDQGDSFVTVSHSLPPIYALQLF